MAFICLGEYSTPVEEDFTRLRDLVNQLKIDRSLPEIKTEDVKSLESHPLSLTANDLLVETELTENLFSEPLDLNELLNEVSKSPQKKRKRSDERATGNGKVGSKSYSCNYCSKKVFGEWQWMLHMKNHVGAKAMECQQCGKEIKTRRGMLYHRNHRREHGIVCEVCGKEFKAKALLRHHIKVVHTMTEYSFPCDHCDKKFKTKGNLKNHLNSVHSEERNFICDLCGHASKSAAQLSSHKLTHLKDKPFKCDYCDKSFLSQFWLDQHRGQHLNDRPFPCNQCDKTFVSERGLRGHMEVVHSIDKFFCGICKMAFRNFQRARSHLISHTEFKPYVCMECHAIFNHNQTAARHAKSAHPLKKVSITIKRPEALLELEANTIKKINSES